MKGIKRTVVFILIMMTICIYSLADSMTVLRTYAQEDAADEATSGSCTETTENNLSETDLTVEENEQAVNSEENEYIYYGTSFYILNGIDTEIPYEISSYPSSNYSAGISILGAVSSFDEIVGTDLADEPAEDIYYADNNVTQALNELPTIEQIQSVRSDFDPSIHYIQWYVIKNSGYYMHVDGVIMTRKNSEAASDSSSAAASENSSEASSASSSEASSDASSEVSSDSSSVASSTSSSAESSTSSSEASSDATSEAASESSSAASDTDEEQPDITIELETILGNPVVPDDGEKHLVGEGFKIKIIDNKEPESLTEKIYDAFGKFLKTNVITVSAADGNGTTFEYKHCRYWINVDAAYAYVTAKDISEKGLTIPFIFDGEVIEPEDIRVGVVDKVTGIISALKSETNVAVQTRQASVDVNNVLTLEAGTTVKNDDGNTLTNDDYEVIDGSLKEGHCISNVVFNGSQTGVGESSNEITSVVIVDSQGNDVTSQYVIKCVSGRLVLVDGGSGAGTGSDSVDSAVTSASEVTTISFPSVSSAASSSVSVDISASLKNDVFVSSEQVLSTVPGSSVLGARLSATGDFNGDIDKRIAFIALSLVVCTTFLSLNKSKDFFRK